MTAKPPTDAAAERLIAQAQQIADRDFLQAMLDGRVNLLDPALYETRLLPMFARIAPGSKMEKLFERAAYAYSDAASEAAYRCLSRLVCDAARDGTLGELREDFEADDRDAEDDNE